MEPQILLQQGGANEEQSIPNVPLHKENSIPLAAAPEMAKSSEQAVPEIVRKIERKRKKRIVRKKNETIPENLDAYTQDQKKQYYETKEAWKKKTVIQLRKELRSKGQTMTGKKAELLTKLADGIVLGVIPSCPYCFVGRLRFNQSTGAYFCPGYYDDVAYQDCKKFFSFKEISRTPWSEQ